MDITIINDYTIDSMLKGCDQVIDMINKLFGTQEVGRIASRKTASDLLEQLGDKRIGEGATRVAGSELFIPPEEQDFEK